MARRKASAMPVETTGFPHKEPQIGRSSDNRRFRSPNYSAWRRSRTESLLSNARYFIISPPCARFARALGAPRTALFATPPLGAGALGIALELDITDSIALDKPARACPASSEALLLILT